MLAIDKLLSLLRAFVNYDCNKFYTIGPWEEKILPTLGKT